MDFTQYQCTASTTAVYPQDKAIEYLSTGLAAEAGEVCGKIAKSFRGDKGLDREAVISELGDVLWFISELSTQLGVSLEDVAKGNAKKLFDRQQRGALKGDGDNR